MRSTFGCCATRCWTPLGAASTPGRWSGTSSTSACSPRSGTTASPPDADGRRSARNTRTCFSARPTERSRAPRAVGSSCSSRRSPRRSWSARGRTRGGYRLDANANGTKPTSTREGDETATTTLGRDEDGTSPATEEKTTPLRLRSTPTPCGTRTGSARSLARRRRGSRGSPTTPRWRCSIRRPAIRGPRPTQPPEPSSPTRRGVFSPGCTSRRSTPGGTTTRSRNGSRGCGTCSPATWDPRADRGTACWAFCSPRG
mmetsp:Transcript_10823/g.43623  ORF Transcript_10823/g.43623 Transcript_10823/m.43623 type:complete len:257 (+) Transcript_10823:66-836(+)